MSDPAPCCGNCMYHFGSSGPTPHCRRLPPVIYSKGSKSAWPLTDDEGICGEYQREPSDERSRLESGESLTKKGVRDLVQALRDMEESRTSPPVEDSLEGYLKDLGLGGVSNEMTKVFSDLGKKLSAIRTEEDLDEILNGMGLAQKVPADLNDPDDEANCLAIPGTVPKGEIINWIHQDLRHYLKFEQAWRDSKAPEKQKISKVQWNAGASFAILKVLSYLHKSHEDDQEVTA